VVYVLVPYAGLTQLPWLLIQNTCLRSDHWWQYNIP